MTRALVIGLDSCEPVLFRRLMDDGRMSNVKDLLARGSWSDVRASDVGSASIWPDFLTGRDAEYHGVYGEWLWDPYAMELVRQPHHVMHPFYDRLRARGRAVGIIDVPFAPVGDSAGGFDVSEWGPHYRIRGSVAAHPNSVAEEIAGMPHPYAKRVLRPKASDDIGGMAEVGAKSLAGAALRTQLTTSLVEAHRPDLMMVVFQEMHHAGHYLWHTLGPNDRYPDLPAAAFRLDVGIDDIYAAIDDEIGILLDAMPDASVFVVSLNGMDFYRGTPLLLGDALRRWGMASLHGIATSGWRQRLRMVLAGAKSRSPHWLKHLYQRGVSRSVRLDLARSTLLEPFDWGSTRAFPVPPEENSYIRINLAGREAQGTVTASELPRVIDEICERLEALRAEDGSPAVRKLFRPGGDRSASPVPDIIVHWNHETTFPPGRIGGLPRYRLAAPHHTGHHRPLGFCITSTTNGETPPATVATTDLHRWIEAAVTGGT